EGQALLTCSALTATAPAVCAEGVAGQRLSAYQTSSMVRRIMTACLAWATMPTRASASSVRYQPQLSWTASVKAPWVKSAEFSEPTSSIRPATTPTAPAKELKTTSTIIGMFPKTDTTPTTAPTVTPTRTATQSQSMPRA